MLYASLLTEAEKKFFASLDKETQKGIDVIAVKAKYEGVMTPDARKKEIIVKQMKGRTL